VLVQEFLMARQDPEQLKVFINTVLGETWEERTARVRVEDLAARAEDYGVDVPAGVGVLTAGVDVQGDRIELLVRGWGAGEESWGIRHERIYGDPQLPATWERLETLLVRPYTHAAGAALRIWVAMLDTGYLADVVYQFIRPRQSRNVFAAKGVDVVGREPLQRATKANRYGVKLFSVGTIAYKDALFGRLAIQRPGPRYLHFPRSFDAEYFAQLGAEKVVRERGRRSYKQIRERNEAIDLEVLNLAALHALGLGGRESLGELAAKWNAGGSGDAGAAAARPRSRIARPPRRGWLNRW
jgi:phage terminase large subunit GpA-like protein